MTPADAMAALRALGCGDRWCAIVPGAPDAPAAGCRCLPAMAHETRVMLRQVLGLWQVVAGDRAR